MKTKEQAAKILLDADWTLEEVSAVLGKNEITITVNNPNPQPMPAYYQPLVIQPSPWPDRTFEPGWRYPITTSGS